MNALRQAWATIAKQMGQLTGKDRALIGSLVIVGVMALVLVAMWSSKPALVQLLPDMGPTEQAAATAALTDADIEHVNKGGKVYVTPEKRLYALAFLQQAGKLPENTTTLFSALSKGSNWMMPRADAERMANAALCEVLSGVIGNFKGVEGATVMIDAPESMGMGAAFRKPTASVGVMLKAGKSMDRDMVDAIAAMVSGAKAGLSMGDVRVIDQRRGEQHSPRVSNTLGGGSGTLGSNGSYLELIAGLEERIHSKIAEQIRVRDPFSLVTVTLQADNTIKRTITDSYLPEKKGTVSVLESTTTDKTNTASPSLSGNGAPGLTSNIPTEINTGGGGGGGGGSSTEKTTDTMKVGLGKTHTEELAPGGMPTRVAVMISLSREYIINLVKTKKGPVAAAGGGAADAKADEPTQQEIDDTFAAEKKKMEIDLTPLIQSASVEVAASSIPRVTVSLIPVAQLGLAGMGGGGGGGMGGSNMASVGSGAGGMMGQLTSGPMIRTAFLGGLAVVALGMMLMLVRKSSKPQNLPSPEELAGLPPVIDAGEDVVGEADEGATAMVGIELGETQIKTKKMLESIEELVKKNPMDGANLMNRWMNVER